MCSSSVIAIVDDDEAIRAALSSLLRSLGYEVRLFASAESFLADSRASPDCLVTDIQMPGMNGLQLQLAIRNRRPRLPVIVITAFPEDAVREQAIAAGALHFLSKPFEADAIARCLSEAVGGAR
ncbi:response regulator receiver domain-containing protein [Humitalea rosea]|uniref:Response regulator receiver domain-containing protein n=1 Tax=Humitalea rosea TaxID=990373 RepID=A0A2W7IA36_9PROT|nr:response regulator [Humitalea rosea]PZW42988.1 response regulator receiver domain-containing protein [Humitalea rosea]